VAARDRNGIVQAIEHQALPFVVGVQWHPEYLPQLPRQRRIFQGLVEAARQVRLKSTGSEPGCERPDRASAASAGSGPNGPPATTPPAQA
jgi:hypothetical protein